MRYVPWSLLALGLVVAATAGSGHAVGDRILLVLLVGALVSAIQFTPLGAVPQVDQRDRGD
ncbi:hypothetical protein GCM10022231_02490 [Gordonia caeni]|uniref:Uncharacterized protein n=1 Tax=Gordonia caeni TaxID=1007097 RepID=A0ABP7NL33_9ACTN